ncbi:MCE family protein [Nocardia sp. NPDC052566]|uniref:MCE family protein n=1 Tax=Nocardia sp. NPDC052566 TaxID=3364330 RepID=UPI0037CAC81C
MRAAGTLATLSAITLCTACGFTVDSLPLPNPGTASETYTVRAVFANVLNLPDQAKVKLGGSDVGIVTHITTRDYQAVVELTIDKNIQLPTDSTAQLRQATPLGDVFIAVTPPEVSTGMLRDGDTIPIERTSAGATVEELLVSISLLFNGGGLADLGKVTAELDSIVGGRADQLASVITQTTRVFTGLHENTERIDAALAGLDALTSTVEAHRAELGEVADTLPQTLGAIAENNRALGDLLAKVAVTSAALGDYADTSADQLSGLLDNTRKLMDALAATGPTFGALLDALHEIRPAVDASFRGSSLATYATITNLDVALLTAPGTSQFPTLPDLEDNFGSLIQMLQIIHGRITGGHR